MRHSSSRSLEPTQPVTTPPYFVIAALSLAALLAHSACVSAEEAHCTRALQPATLEPGVGFGGLHLGMSQDEVEGLIGAAERGEGGAWEYPSCGFAVMFDRDEKKLGVLLAGDTSGIGAELRDRFTVTTADGLGIGSTQEEIEAALGQPSETLIEDSDVQTLVYSSQGIRWMLRSNRVEHVTIRRAR